MLPPGPVPGTNIAASPPHAARAEGAAPRSGRSSPRPGAVAASLVQLLPAPPVAWWSASLPSFCSGHLPRADGRTAAAVRRGVRWGGRRGGQQVDAGVETLAAACAEVQHDDEGTGTQIDAGRGDKMPVGGLGAGTEAQLGGFEAASAGTFVRRLRVRRRDRRHLSRPAALFSRFVSVSSDSSGAAPPRRADEDFGQNGFVVDDFEGDEGLGEMWGCRRRSTWVCTTGSTSPSAKGRSGRERPFGGVGPQNSVESVLGVGAVTARGGSAMRRAFRGPQRSRGRLQVGVDGAPLEMARISVPSLALSSVVHRPLSLLRRTVAVLYLHSS
ncbi:unnamed protein product [Prorocentrum cordatum]|uniref:Uncharacterized protein n=1 Tax=Prorocentrum cordatum TaxID=2364126 RepID=A0ABN9QN31_9DINO|nr:unnamed protein product [Polarella glacialis]